MTRLSISAAVAVHVLFFLFTHLTRCIHIEALGQSLQNCYSWKREKKINRRILLNTVARVYHIIIKITASCLQVLQAIRGNPCRVLNQ